MGHVQRGLRWLPRRQPHLGWYAPRQTETYRRYTKGEPMIDRVPHVHSYARASNPRVQVISLDRQVDSILAESKRLAAQHNETMGECFTDGVSAEKIRWNERPGFCQFLDIAQESDRLVIWRVDRLERGPIWQSSPVIGWFIDHGVHLHTLDGPSGPMDLTSKEGEAMWSMQLTFARYEQRTRTEACQAGKKYCREMGWYTGQKVAYGHRLKTVAGWHRGRRRQHKILVWDQREIAQIRQIWQRYLDGESLADIGAWVHAEQWRTAMGAPWCGMYGRRSRNANRINMSRIYRVVAWHRERLSRGLDLGIDAVEDVPLSSDAAYQQSLEALALKENR